MEYVPGWREKQNWPCPLVVVDATAAGDDALVAVTFLAAAWEGNKQYFATCQDYH